MVVRGPLSVASLAGNARVVQTGPAAASHLDLETFNDFGVPGAPANFTLTAARTAELDLAGGRAELGGAVTVAGQAAGRLIQSGPDTVATVSGPLRVSSAGSEARLDLTGDSWTAKGTTAVTGLGRAVVNLTTATTDRFEQNVAVTGGLGLDLVTASPTARFLRNLSVGLGAGGGQLALDPGVTVGGALTVNGGTGVDVVSIRGVSVGGNTRIVTGGGKDTLTVDQGSTFTGTFYADLGGGDDTIAVAQSGGSPVTFSGEATILAGLGDDTLRLGQAGVAGAQAVFTTAGSLIDGGMGLNLFDDEAASFTGPVTIVHWTDPTP
jgi:hypothetical protein